MYIYICGEDFYWLMSVNAESNESAVGDKIKENDPCGLLGPCAGPHGPPLWPGPLSAGPLWAPLGPYGPGPYGPPWALTGRALMGPLGIYGPGPSWPPLALLGRARMGGALMWPPI